MYNASNTCLSRILLLGHIGSCASFLWNGRYNIRGVGPTGIELILTSFGSSKALISDFFVRMLAEIGILIPVGSMVTG